MSYLGSLICIRLPSGLGGESPEGFIYTPSTSALLHMACPRGRHGGFRVVGFLTWQLASRGMKAEAAGLRRGQLAQCHFYRVLLVKVSHGVSLDSGGGETDFSS